METNPYQYGKPVPWIPQQNQFSEDRKIIARISQQRSDLQHQGLQQRGEGHSSKPVKPMPKARALALTRMFKKCLAAASLVGFLSFGGLVAFHQVGSTTTASPSSSTSFGSSQTTSSSNSSSQNNSSFFNNQGGNNFGTSNSSQGSSTSSSSPVSGTHTS